MNKRNIILLLISLIPIVFLSCVDKTNLKEISYESEKQKRMCLVEIPNRSVSATKFALLLILHGRNESKWLARYRTNDHGLFIKNGIIPAYPNGAGIFRHTWGDVACEISLLKALIDTLTSRFNIDTTRVYIAGFSQGADIVYTMAYRFPRRIAAFAIVASGIDSVNVQNWRPLERAVSMISFNSMNDPVCRSDSFSYKGKWYNSPETGIKAWAGKIGCAQQPDTVIKGPCATMKRWSNRSGAEAILWITAKGGHAWPGGRGILHIPHFEPSNCINANELMCKFFLRHSTQ
jgi:polyhydroxybutyrate depolymerase